MSDSAGPVRVLVVDDEPNIVDVVSMALRHNGFEVAEADTGAGALERVREWQPNVLVLDVMLPDIDGFEVARRLARERAGLPILFLTARDGTTDKVWGLNTGGGDYVTKPFSLEELVARLRNIVRRTGVGGDSTGRLTFADLELDEETREVSRGGRPIELTATEYRLLHYFMSNPRRVLTRAQLLEHVWRYDFAGDARVLETYVSYLRKKIDDKEHVHYRDESRRATAEFRGSSPQLECPGRHDLPSSSRYRTGVPAPAQVRSTFLRGE